MPDGRTSLHNVLMFVGTVKTIEGSLASLLSQLVVMGIIAVAGKISTLVGENTNFIGSLSRSTASLFVCAGLGDHYWQHCCHNCLGGVHMADRQSCVAFPSICHHCRILELKILTCGKKISLVLIAMQNSTAELGNLNLLPVFLNVLLHSVRAVLDVVTHFGLKASFFQCLVCKVSSHTDGHHTHHHSSNLQHVAVTAAGPAERKATLQFHPQTGIQSIVLYAVQKSIEQKEIEKHMVLNQLTKMTKSGCTSQGKVSRGCCSKPSCCPGNCHHAQGFLASTCMIHTVQSNFDVQTIRNTCTIALTRL